MYYDPDRQSPQQQYNSCAQTGPNNATLGASTGPAAQTPGYGYTSPAAIAPAFIPAAGIPYYYPTPFPVPTPYPYPYPYHHHFTCHHHWWWW